MKSLPFIAVLLFAVFGFDIRAANSASSLFPFVVPGDDVSAGVTDMSFLNTGPADPLVTSGNGHFYAGGQRAGEIVPQQTGGGVSLRLGPQYKTLWYEVAIE